MSKYLKSAGGSRTTPQSEAIPGSTQVPNSAGGFAWKVDEFTRLRRFCILGSEGGSHYSSERDLTKENITGTRAAIVKDGPRVVKELLDISLKGRAPKQGPTLFVLALCISSASGASEETRRAAAAAVPQICRTATMLFEFLGYAKANRGMGRLLKATLAKWYNDQEVDKLAMQVVKYRNREGYTHRDALRLAHPVPASTEHETLYSFAVGRLKAERPVPAIVAGFMEAQAAEDAKASVHAITEYNLPRECIKPKHLNDSAVWDALLMTGKGMPYTAMIRNLGKMSAVGLLKPATAATKAVISRLGNGEDLRKARVHPISVLAALMVYKQGHGEKGKLSWTPVPKIVDALDEAFYEAFGNVTPTGKNLLLAIDISGSMDSGVVAGIPGLTPRVGAAAMALVTAAVEPNTEIVGFTSKGIFGGRPSMHGSQYPSCLTVLDISKRRRLDDVVKYMKSLDLGGTDCALPMLYATEEKKDIDGFILYTDSETWAGHVHPSQALAAYRRKMNKPNACSAVVAMVANEFSIASPDDARMLDVVGFDTATPNILSQFIEGDL